MNFAETVPARPHGGALPPSIARRARQATGLSQRSFARLIGVHHVTIAKWERGARPLSGVTRALLLAIVAEPRAIVTALRAADACYAGPMSPGPGDLPVIVSRISPQPGPCKKCRHSNQGTQDMKSGYIACRFKGGVMRDAVCDLAIQKRETNETVGYCFEEFDGKNGTWAVEARVHFEPREAPPKPGP